MLATGGDAKKTTIYDVKTKAKIHEFKRRWWRIKCRDSQKDGFDAEQLFIMQTKQQRYCDVKTKAKIHDPF